MNLSWVSSLNVAVTSRASSTRVRSEIPYSRSVSFSSLVILPSASLKSLVTWKNLVGSGMKHSSPLFFCSVTHCSAMLALCRSCSEMWGLQMSIFFPDVLSV